MIRFKDFAPGINKHGFSEIEFESFEDALAAANEWVAQDRIEVLNVETVLLPEKRSNDGTAQTNSVTSDLTMFGSSWLQFIRVWYKTD